MLTTFDACDSVKILTVSVKILTVCSKKSKFNTITSLKTQQLRITAEMAGDLCDSRYIIPRKVGVLSKNEVTALFQTVLLSTVYIVLLKIIGVAGVLSKRLGQLRQTLATDLSIVGGKNAKQAK